MRRLISFLIVFAIFIMLMLLQSCGVQHHLKRAHHHIEKAKAKGYVPLTDTVFISQEVILKEVKTDTIFQDVGDTVTLVKERLKVEYYRDTVTNQVYLSGECKTDTVYVDVPVVKEVYVREKTLLESAGIDTWWKQALLWLAVIVLVVLLLAKFVFGK